MGALAVRSQGCYVEVQTSDVRNVITPTCSLDCTLSPGNGYEQTVLNVGFRTEYRDEALTKRGLRVCMIVGEGNSINQCVVEAEQGTAAGAASMPCMPVVQTPVPSAYSKVGDKWMMASENPMNQEAARAFCGANGGVLARPRSINETLAIAEFMKGDHVYIGATDEGNEGDWYFSDATSNNAEKSPGQTGTMQGSAAVSQTTSVGRTVP